MIQTRRYFTGERLFYETLGSTNDHILSMLTEANPDEGTVIYTAFQTGGRGHMNNTWESEVGKNLLFSILLLPDFLLPSSQFELSKIISLALADIVAKYCDNVAIKWPNDILVGGKKIAGILIENVVTFNRITRCIAGIGLNVNQEKFSENIPNPTSLVLETGCQSDMTDLLDQVVSRIEYWYNSLYNDEIDYINREYFKKLYRINELSEFVSRGESFKARITGLEPTGELAVETEEGRKLTFGFKEIEFL
jgi:BirA family transcriptional regulator, biotin operon repressor / biotin---[acetyl-CoA-carboxylase] ligase